jgi:hypothetical protein
MSAPTEIARPSAGECSEGAGSYVARVVGSDAWPVLVAQVEEVHRRLGHLSEDRALHRYAPEKWSVKEVVGHLSDAERVYVYRALRFARSDSTPLPGFDENLYVPAGRFDIRPMAALLDEWRTVRMATLSLFRGLDAAALCGRGVANGSIISVRALAWLAAGHTQHHLGVLRERYGIG